MWSHRHLENLRQRPEPERQKISFFLAVILTGVVALVWTANLLFIGIAPDAEANLASAIEASKKKKEKNIIRQEWERIKTGFGVVEDRIRRTGDN